jgi:hypothetical protein
LLNHLVGGFVADPLFGDFLYDSYEAFKHGGYDLLVGLTVIHWGEVEVLCFREVIC